MPATVPLEELVMAIETRKIRDRSRDRNIKSSEIYETARMVSRAMNFPIAFNKPIIGRNAFQHESGIHQDGLLKNRNTYEIMDPEAMGIPRSMIVLGKHSGRHAIKHRLNEFGITLNDEQLVDVYNRFIAKADELKLVPDHELIRLASESTDIQHDPYILVDLQVLAGTNKSRIASVTIRERDSQEESLLLVWVQDRLKLLFTVFNRRSQLPESSRTWRFIPYLQVRTRTAKRLSALCITINGIAAPLFIMISFLQLRRPMWAHVTNSC